MPVSPDQVGVNGNVVRQVITDMFEKIDQLLLDPVWTQANNRRTEDQPEGTQIYEFSFRGQLNATELDTLASNWGSEGWTSVEIANLGRGRHESPDSLSWKLKLTYIP